MRLGLILLPFTLVLSCNQYSQDFHLLKDIDPYLEGQWVNMVVEVPAGTIQKWEVNKKSGYIERDSINGQPRTIDYIGYPGNYGFIPQTLLPKSKGGDGDPLDVLVIGAPVKRGAVVRCKILGILKLTDNGDQDDKLIAVAQTSRLSTVNNLESLEYEYPGILSIIETWFSNYKGDGVVMSNGYVNIEEALSLLKRSLEDY